MFATQSNIKRKGEHQSLEPRFNSLKKKGQCQGAGNAVTSKPNKLPQANISSPTLKCTLLIQTL